jgi:pectate lyase
VSLVSAYDAANDPDIPTTVSWDPQHVDRLHSTRAVPALVAAKAGSGRSG